MTNPLRAKFQQLSLPAQPAPAAAPAAPTGQDTALALLRAKLAGSQARVNPPEAKIADEALTPKTAAVVTAVATEPSATPAKRTRRTKAEMEAAAKETEPEATYAHADAVEPLAAASVESFSTDDLLREIFRRIQL